MKHPDLLFRTVDSCGLGAANSVLYYNIPFFDASLNYTENIREVYIETTGYQLEATRKKALKDFNTVARSFEYESFAYTNQSDWANPLRIWLVGEFVESVLRFNARNLEASFRGVCLDIQPSELPGSDGDDAYFRNCLEHYVECLADVKKQVDAYNIVKEKDFQLRIVLPSQLYRLAEDDDLRERLKSSCHQIVRLDYVGEDDEDE